MEINRHMSNEIKQHRQKNVTYISNIYHNGDEGP